MASSFVNHDRNHIVEYLN